MNPAISILMPVYNGSCYLREQLDSIVNQTEKNFELIISDDGSSDDSVAIAKEYAAKDSRIKVIASGRNGGLNANLTRAFEASQGQLLAISDQDDVWHLEKLSLLLQNLGTHSGAYCNSALIDGSGRSMGKTIMECLKIERPAAGKRSFSLLYRNCVSGHALLMRRSVFERSLPFMRVYPYDQQLAITASFADGLFYYPESLVYHRIHGKNSCNGGLLGKKEKGKKKRKSWKKKMVERRNTQKLLLPFIAKLGILKKDYDKKRFRTQWINLPLFFFILSEPYFSLKPTFGSRLQTALRFAKGLRWYKFERFCSTLLGGRIR
jgi:glycosyltransferase involved in cell wall biosynthesis